MEDGNPILTLLYFAFLREIQTVHKAQLMLWKGGKMASCYLLSSKRKWGEPGVLLGGTEKWNRQEGAAIFQTTADSKISSELETHHSLTLFSRKLWPHFSQNAHAGSPSWAVTEGLTLG